MRTVVRVAPALLALVALAMPAAAQLQRGAVHGTVIASTGAVLPGATVTLSSPVMTPQTTVSGSHGEFRFGQLDPGTYTLSVSLQEFAPYTCKDIGVGTGSSINLRVQMAPASIKQAVTVSAATPVLDEKEHGNTTRFGAPALTEIPTARDPWVLLQHVPGVQVDRVNVGGSESGDQSALTARWDNGANTMWNIDGVTITDMAAIGSSATYYDFDVFQQVQFSTAATDPREQTGALGINIVTKRGTNEFHGLGRYFFDNGSLQAANLPANLTPCPPGVSVGARCYAGNKINEIVDYGGDLGGAIFRNKLWFWGSLARTDIKRFAMTGAPDNALVDTQAGKIDFQATANNHADLFFYRAHKIKNGQNTAGIATTWTQAVPTEIYKFEDMHTFGAHWLATARYAHVTSGFSPRPQGGVTASVWNDVDAGGVWHGGYVQASANRPQDQVNADASYFRGIHELKFGLQYRRTPVTSMSQWPNGAYSLVATSLGLPAGTSLVTLTRAKAAGSIQYDTGMYAGETVSLQRLTLDLAVRYDRQDGFNSAANVPANPIAPAILPAISFPAQVPGFEWNAWSPRAGATYRLNDKTIVRGTYALFEGQLPAAYILATNPVQLSGVTYLYADNGTHVPTASNIDFSNVISSYGFDPAKVAVLASPNSIDPNLKPPRTHSIIVGFDREVLPNFSLSASFGYARMNDLIWQMYPGLTSADFVKIRTIGRVTNPTTGATVTSNTPYYTLAPGVTLPSGSLLTNRQGYHQRYWNWDITATKRLADRWMLRGYLTLQNNQEFFDDRALAIQDPTPLAVAGAGSGDAGYSSHPEFGQTTWVMPNYDGGVVTTWAGSSSGATTDVFMQSKWSYSLMALYEFGMGISASGTVYGRQGYPSPLYFTVNRGVLGTRSPVLVDPNLDDRRNPNVNLVDLRVEKTFKYGRAQTILSLDGFNLLNNNTVLQVNRLITASTFGQPRQIVAPRIFRLGLRFRF